MKLTQILIILLALAYGHSASAMDVAQAGARKTKHRFKIGYKKPILKQVLISEHKKDSRNLRAAIKETYKSSLDLLYDQTLEQDQANKQAIPAIALPALLNTIKDQITSLEQDLINEIHRYNSNGLRFKDIAPIIKEFKKEKGFATKPDLDTINLQTMLKFHAMLRTLANSLNEINEWICPTNGEIEEDI